MGQILRLDGRVAIEDQEGAAVGVVTSTWRGGCKGRVWLIGPHKKPELRLKAWGKRRELRPASYDVEEDADGGTIDYQALAPGVYEAESTPHRDRDLVAAVVFRVGPAADSVEILARAARSGDGSDAVVAELSGWTLDRLRAEREAYAAALAEACRAAGFADLVGTPRQVEWANEFRGAKIIHALDHLAERTRHLRELAEDAPGHFATAVDVQWLVLAANLLPQINRASWWVARVQTPGAEILRDWADECRVRRHDLRLDRVAVAAGRGVAL